MVNRGDVIFFKTGKKGSHRKMPEMKFKGYGFGVFLGHVPPFQKDPPASELLKLMGAIGFLTFDNVAEFLGDEMGAKCVKAFEDKYYGKEVPDQAFPEPEASPILDSSGLPIEAPHDPVS